MNEYGVAKAVGGSYPCEKDTYNKTCKKLKDITVHETKQKGCNGDGKNAAVLSQLIVNYAAKKTFFDYRGKQYGIKDIPLV